MERQPQNPEFTGIILKTFTHELLTLILLIFFDQKISSAYYICCICSNALKTNFITKTNTMNPDQTAPMGTV